MRDDIHVGMQPVCRFLHLQRPIKDLETQETFRLQDFVTRLPPVHRYRRDDRNRRTALN